MDAKIFRAYSIRGIVGQSLTDHDMRQIGRAVGTILGAEQAVVGRDHRLSSPALAQALIAGLLDTGMSVLDIGACPTPMLNFATDHYQAQAGLMVTASHNPPAYNGLKIRTDHSLGGDELRRIYEAAVQGDFRQGQGQVAQVDPRPVYLEAICRCVQMARPLRVVVDAGSGAAGPIAPELIERLGCRPIGLYCEPDGRFPHRAPDPTAPGALDALINRVLEERADAGLAYDGDADRLAMVDDGGRVVFGDQLLALLAVPSLKQHPQGKVIYELSCTQAVAEVVEAAGGEAIACPVGYAFVHQRMRKARAVLGGEAAGHIFFAEPGFQFDDALLATAKMLALLSQTERPFSSLLAELPQYHLSPEYRFACPDEQKSEVIDRLRSWFVERGLPMEQMDGVKAHWGDGWSLVRCSNTQPAITLRCEARSPVRLDEIEHTILSIVQDALRQSGIEMVSAH